MRASPASHSEIPPTPPPRMGVGSGRNPTVPNDDDGNHSYSQSTYGVPGTEVVVLFLLIITAIPGGTFYYFIIQFTERRKLRLSPPHAPKSYRLC